VSEQDSVAGFLERLADGTPTPGGGAAAALTAATAAALLGMVSRVVSRRAAPPATPAEADELRHRALALIAEDAHAYAEFVAARRSTSAGDVARDRALVRATEAPLAVARVGDAILERCAALATVASGPVRSDLDVAVTLARAARNAACNTVRANTGDLRDRAEATRLEDEVDRLSRAESQR